MKKNLTEIVFILDCSGSMNGLEGDTIGGAIHHIGNVRKYARPEDVPEHTLFVITTDGLENASRHYDIDRVKSMIERRKKKYGWEFMFLGANIDAVETAGWIGIDADRAVNYRCDGIGTALNFEVLSDAISDVRADEELTPQWKKESTRTSVPGAAEKNKGEWTCLRPVWAPPLASGGLFSGAICSPFPANPCSFVPGSKIFTQNLRRHTPPAGLSVRALQLFSEILLTRG